MTISPGYLNLPTDLFGWIGWFFLAVVLAAGLIGSIRAAPGREKTTDSRSRRSSLWRLVLALLLLLLAPLAGSYFVYELPVGDALPIPGAIIEPSGPHLAVFALLPSFLAAVLLGGSGWLVPAAVVLTALISGAALAWFDTHHIFTPLILALLSLAVYAALHQRYRSIEFRLLRVPILTTLVLAPFGGLLLFIADLCVASGSLQASLLPGISLAGRIDFAISRFWYQWVALSGELVAAGLLLTLLLLIRPALLASAQPLRPSPMEASLPLRLLYQMTPFAVFLLGMVIYTSWTLAGQSARDMLETHLKSNTQIVGDTIPFFLESGQNLIQYMASDATWTAGSSSEKQEYLLKARITFPFFDELYLLDTDKNTLASYPPVNFADSATPEENDGLELALFGIPFQQFTIPPRRNAAEIESVVPVTEGSGESTGLINTASGAVSFMTTVTNPESGETVGILVGRANLYLNPLTHPVIVNLAASVGDSLSETGIREVAGTIQSGEALLADQNGLVLYHTNFEELFDAFQFPENTKVLSGELPAGSNDDGGVVAAGDVFYEDRAPDGTRRLVYYHPTPALPWGVVLSIPARHAQQLALDIATPTLIVVVVVFTLIGALLTFGLRGVSQALNGLVLETRRIAGGQLDHPLPVSGVDEVGQFRSAFEMMRRSLKARIDELNRLLAVSQQIAGSLDMDTSMAAVLNAALTTGAATARLVLTDAAMPSTNLIGAAGSRSVSDPAAVFNAQRTGGIPSGWRPQELDVQVLALAANTAHRLTDHPTIRSSEHSAASPIILTNLPRLRLFTFSPGVQRPESLLAVPLRHEQDYFGVLWLGFDQSRTFGDEETTFISTLAGQATLAASNARLFQNAEIGRQQLASILDSSPDPVIVTDHQDNLLLANPAAWRLLGLDQLTSQGKPLDQVIEDPDLLNVLRKVVSDTSPSLVAGESTATAEINGVDGRVYFAMCSTIRTARPAEASAGTQNEQEMIPIGRVCVLRDVTHFKQLDQLKSEFVSTVSHDLRSPLTLMRGYANMLEMVGTLNDQQRSYIQKIVYGVDNMARMVGNLLDIGRIEAGVDLQLDFIDPGELTQRVTSGLQMQASQKQIALKIEIPGGSLPPIQADQALLQQAIQNLVENAVKYTDPGGQVAVTAAVKNEVFQLRVRDSGIGIAPVDQPRLFEKFYRGAQHDARKRQGTGLGLAIVKSIAERHGGSVGVESQLGKGSIFWMKIPIRQPSKGGQK